jgi:hypothetical protein
MVVLGGARPGGLGVEQSIFVTLPRLSECGGEIEMERGLTSACSRQAKPEALGRGGKLGNLLVLPSG